MRILFVASLHHPHVLQETRRNAPAGEDPLFPLSQMHYFWVKALRKLGHICAVFWRSQSVWPWARPRQLIMAQRPRAGIAFNGLLELLPSLNPDFRLRNGRLIRQAAEFQPELVILIGGNNVILPQTLAAVKRSHGAILVYSSGTSPVVFSTPVERAAAPLYDLVICNDYYHAVQWQELGAPRVKVLPLSAVDPSIHHPYSLSETERAQYGCDVGFVGTLVPANLYSERVAALEALRDFDLGIWSIHQVPGSLSKFSRGPALGEQMLRAICAVKIVINPHGNFMRYGGNMRLFEACGVGAFQIADDRPGVQKWFKVGEHLATYRDPEHLRGLVSYYLDHHEERERVAANGRRHVYADHTYDLRMKRLMSLVDEIGCQPAKPRLP